MNELKFNGMDQYHPDTSGDAKLAREMAGDRYQELSEALMERFLWLKKLERLRKARLEIDDEIQLWEDRLEQQKEQT